MRHSERNGELISISLFYNKKKPPKDEARLLATIERVILMKKIAILTSGGDAPGMNAAIRSAVRRALYYGMEIDGIHRGYAGLLSEEIEPMETTSVSGIILRGGTMLKTARCLAFHELENQKKAVEILRKHGIEGLIIIGGDGSIKGAEAISNLGLPTVTVPGTIDNDMRGTDETIGHDTAVNVVLEAVSRIRDSASAHDRAAIIEVMGRDAGQIALHAGLACGAEYILIPEFPFDREKLAQSLKEQRDMGRTNNIIICAEGAADGKELANWLKEKTKIDICATILGFIQRGGQPSARDCLLGSLLGAKAVDVLRDGKDKILVGMERNQVRLCGYEGARNEPAPDLSELYCLARVLSNV